MGQTMDADELKTPVAGAQRERFAGMQIDVGYVGDARIKRLVYPPGSRWSKHVKPHVGTDWCSHAHVGYLAQGRFVGEYSDGRVFDYQAPAIISVEPNHDSWVEGNDAVVLIQFDFQTDTLRRLGLPPTHADR